MLWNGFCEKLMKLSDSIRAGHFFNRWAINNFSTRIKFHEYVLFNDAVNFWSYIQRRRSVWSTSAMILTEKHWNTQRKPRPSTAISTKTPHRPACSRTRDSTVTDYTNRQSHSTVLHFNKLVIFVEDQCHNCLNCYESNNHNLFSISPFLVNKLSTTINSLQTALPNNLRITFRRNLLPPSSGWQCLVQVTAEVFEKMNCDNHCSTRPD